MSKILITGGTGFLGKRLGRALRLDGHEVLLGARNNKQNFAAKRFSGCEVVPLDVTSVDSVRDAVVDFAPEVIVHAAATKFVDLAERQPLEAIDVNVVGSRNVARVALERGVGLVVGISTDKASPPVRNTYGLTKALMERLFCQLDGRNGCRLLCVRYGNVAWSTGSVLPVWRGMLKDDGVIRTTGPKMLRFFFTVDEAVALVKTAMANAETLHGRIVGRRMKSAVIEDFLRVWVQAEGVRYEVISERPGERWVEYLVGEAERPMAEEIELDGLSHFVIGLNGRVDRPLPGVISSENAERLTEAELLAILRSPPEEEQ